MTWSNRAADLLAKYAKGGRNIDYIRKNSEKQARDDESKVVLRTHVLYVVESMKY